MDSPRAVIAVHSDGGRVPELRLGGRTRRGELLVGLRQSDALRQIGETWV